MLWIFLIILISTGIAAVGAWRARQKMGKALGRKVGESELTSINTWIEVSEAEKKKEG